MSFSLILGAEKALFSNPRKGNLKNQECLNIWIQGKKFTYYVNFRVLRYILSNWYAIVQSGAAKIIQLLVGLDSRHCILLESSLWYFLIYLAPKYVISTQDIPYYDLE